MALFLSILITVSCLAAVVWLISFTIKELVSIGKYFIKRHKDDNFIRRAVKDITEFRSYEERTLGSFVLLPERYFRWCFRRASKHLGVRFRLVGDKVYLSGVLIFQDYDRIFSPTWEKDIPDDIKIDVIRYLTFVEDIYKRLQTERLISAGHCLHEKIQNIKQQ